MARKKKRNPAKENLKAQNTAGNEKKAIPKNRFRISPLNLKLIPIFLGLSILLYGLCIFFGYVLDDKIVISGNQFTQRGFAGIWDILTTDSFAGYFGEQKNLVQGSRYRPLSIVSFAIEYQIFGASPGVSHFINILLYSLCGILSFYFVNRLIQEKVKPTNFLFSFSFAVAALYLLHPLHVEAVANIKGRDEIMSFIFSIAAFNYALKFIDKNQLRHLFLMAFLFFLGLLSKENTLTFLAIIPLGIWFFRKGQMKNNLAIFVLLLAVSVLYILIRVQVIGYLLGETPSSDLMNNAFAEMNVSQQIATTIYTLLQYLKLNIFPHPLTHDYYPYHIPIMSFGHWQVWLSIIIHLILITIMIFSYKKSRIISFALAFYFLAMTIVSNVFVNIGTFMNERFVFSASLGSCILLVSILLKLGDHIKLNTKYAKQIPLLIVLALFALKTLFRVPVWENPLTLNSAAIKVSKNSARANSFMATALFNRYKETEDNVLKKNLIYQAEPYANRAVEIHRNYYNGHLMRAGIAGEIYKFDKDLDKILATYYDIIQVRPDVEFITTFMEYLNKNEDRNKLLEFYTKVGAYLTDKAKDYDYAIHFLNLGMSVDPNNAALRRQVYQTYVARGEIEKAEKYK